MEKRKKAWLIGAAVIALLFLGRVVWVNVSWRQEYQTERFDPEETMTLSSKGYSVRIADISYYDSIEKLMEVHASIDEKHYLVAFWQETDIAYELLAVEIEVENTTGAKLEESLEYLNLAWNGGSQTPQLVLMEEDKRVTDWRFLLDCEESMKVCLVFQFREDFGRIFQKLHRTDLWLRAYEGKIKKELCVQ